MAMSKLDAAVVPTLKDWFISKESLLIEWLGKSGFDLPGAHRSPRGKTCR